MEHHSWYQLYTAGKEASHQVPEVRLSRIHTHGHRYTALIWRIANKANELDLQHIVPNQEGSSTMRPVVDIFTTGYKKFQTSSLVTFNKKLADLRQGRARELKPEVDEITPCQVVEDLDADNVEPLGEQSALHED